MHKFQSQTQPLILVTGATGYVGGRLVPRLLQAGYRVRVLVRDPKRLEGRFWLNNVNVVKGDVYKPDSLDEAMSGVYAAYYLIHSMSGSDDFHQLDLIGSRNFGQIANKTGVQRIIYLGGLGDPQSSLSNHLRSRQQTGDELRNSGVSVTEFRAAVIVGSGSLSFEMIRYLTERVPLMICPRWVFTRIQPISIDDVLDYLVQSLQVDASRDKIIEIGGSDVQTYGDMMLIYANVRGLRRYLIPVPVLTPRLSSYWVHWVTPIPAKIARPLIEGLKNEVIVRSDIAALLFPNIKPIGYEAAVRLALQNLESDIVETVWHDALASSLGQIPPVYLTTEQGLIIERREYPVKAPIEKVFTTICGLGGERGWLYFDVAWKLRGALDRIIGGVGMRRGRRHPDEVRVGDAIDFWRVEALVPDRLLRLRAEMIVPGKAWLQFEVVPQSDSETTIIQTAFFEPKGLLGVMYWYGLYPIHALIFAGMIKQIAEKSQLNYQHSQPLNTSS